jgi:asparagine synthase (glutamine-hydrolysing)
MCGIAGIIRTKHLEPDDISKLKAMLSLQVHRGPDGSGAYADTYCTLGQTRLAVATREPHTIPVSLKDGRYQIVFNGEIYNDADLRNQLRPFFEFRTKSDTEVLLAAWIQWGPRALKKIEGMYSFFIWDSIENRGYAARDPLGVKPFFYTFQNQDFIFASEPQAIVKSGCHRFGVDELAIAETLTAPYFSGATRTPFAGISILEPGCWLDVHNGKIVKHVDRQFQFRPNENFESNGGLAHLENAIAESVLKMSRGESEIGIFLSGGLDSNLISAFASATQGHRLNAWTIEYPGNDILGYEDSLIVKSSDLPFAKLVANDLNLHHHTVSIDEVSFASSLTATLRQNDLICAWEQEVSQNSLAQAAAPYVKAVFVGDAADETHFGYPFLMNPFSVRSPKNIFEFFGVVPLNSKFLTNATEYFDSYYKEYARSRGHSWSTLEDSQLATSQLVTDLWLPRLLYNGDRHTMQHSLEARVPFSDQNVLDLAAQVPFNFATRNGIEKWHLRKIAEKRLSKTLAWRPKSALTKSLRGRTAIFAELKTSWEESGDLISQFVDTDFVDALILKENPSDRDTSIGFRLLSTITWFRNYL